MCFMPFTIICVGPAEEDEDELTTNGVLQVGTSSRLVRHSSWPSLASKAARNCSLTTSHWTMTVLLWRTGELPKPHGVLAIVYHPASILPRSLCQSSRPSMSKQNKPSEPNSAKMRCPSVAGVELQ